MLTRIKSGTFGAAMERAGGVTAGFDYLRLALAFSVLMFHSALSTYGKDDWLWDFPKRGFVTAILPMFFALSGFLVSGSLVRCTSIRDFLTARVFRLAPALMVEVFLSALILGPLVTTLPLRDYFSDTLLYKYFYNMLGDPQYYLPGVFTDTPFVRVNQSLWTLPYELECYMILTVLYLIGVVRRPALLLAATVAITLALLLYNDLRGIYLGKTEPRVLVVAFLWGCCFHSWRYYIPSHPAYALGAVALALIALNFHNTLFYLSPIPVTYITVWLGLRNPKRDRLVASGDYSYGIYLYAFPFQQLYVWLAQPNANPLANIVFASIACALFAAASWHLVEKPFLKLRKRSLWNQRTGERQTPSHRSTYAAWIERVFKRFAQDMRSLFKHRWLAPGAAALVIAGLLVGLGVVLQKYRFLPARVIDRGLDYARMELELRTLRGKSFLQTQYRRDLDRLDLTQTIDTALLPLTMNGVRLSETHQVAKGGGGIVAVGNTLIVVDRLGNFYAIKTPDKPRVLNYPPLPNNIEKYVAVHGLIDQDHFRVYGAVYRRATNELVAAHEIFDPESNGTRMGVSAITIDPETLGASGQWRTIFRGDLEAAGPTLTGGGRLALDARGAIYLTIGVYQINGTDDAQSDQKMLGKIVRLNEAKQTAEIVSRGHRNPQGLFATDAGEIWSTEHGPAGGDELNLIVFGGNYGWPRVTLGVDYDKYSSEGGGSTGRHGGYTPPVFAWLPSIAVSSLIQVRNFDERWNGDLLVASLKGQSLYRLRLENGRVMYSEQIWIGQRIRDVSQLENGAIALWTDDARVLFLSVDRDHLASNKRWPKALGDTVISSCMFCHHFGSTSPADAAPSLSDLFGRKIASDNYRYTLALRSKDGNWTEAALKQFLADPDSFASGTSMPRRELTPEQIDEVVTVLKTLSNP